MTPPSETWIRHVKGCRDCQRRLAELSSDIFLKRPPNIEVLPEMSATNRSQRPISGRGMRTNQAWPPLEAEALLPGLEACPDY